MILGTIHQQKTERNGDMLTKKIGPPVEERVGYGMFGISESAENLIELLLQFK